MWINRVSASLVGGRVDAEFYAPEVYEHLSRMARFSPVPMASFVEDIRSEPPIHTDHYGDCGLHIVSPSNFTDFVINFSSTNKLAPQHRAAFTEFLLRPGRLIFALVGDVGHACIVPEGVPDAISYRRTANILLKGIDVHFVSAFLNTTTGSVQFKRLTTGVIQEQVRLEDSAGILLPTLQPDAQRYIGDKVRQAERLRDRARRLYDFVRLHHQSWIPAFRPSKGKWNAYRVGSRGIEDVIVPHFYPPSVTEYLAGRQNKPLTEICLVIYSGETYDADEKGVDQATSRSCSGRFLKRPCNRVRPPARGDLDLQPHDLLLTNAAHDKAYIGRDVTYFHGGPRNIPSAKVLVLRPNRAVVPASYLYTYLQTPVGYLQVQSAIRGISAGIRAQDVGTIRIPLPEMSVSQLEAWHSMDSLMGEAGASEDAAGGLCASAVALVEQLIESRLNEADLVAAQKALEAGDRSADREILKSLRQSVAPDAKPLIADVDVLYALLDGPEERDP